MKRLVKITITIVLLMVIGLFTYNHFNSPKINKVLRTSEYSYLPVEAKNFIEKVYNDTGEVVLTEKNKEENTPYMNPKYIEYLTLSDKEKEEVAEVPEIYTIDYVSEEIAGATPTTYDLRNVNGKNFVTPIRNQETLDICWTFASSEQIESLLLKNSNTSYNSSSTILSARQIDYATSYNGIKDYHNDLGVRAVGYGGNYMMAAMALSNGLGAVSESYLPFSTSTSQKELYNILNYDNSLYELNSSIAVPNLTSNPTSAQVSSYVSTVKNYVMQYGGAYVTSQSTNGSCASTNTDGNIIVRPDGNCTEDHSHAMHIIGWDDNYSYSYCISNNQHKAPSTCSSGKVTGTGAWILRNSWGNVDQYLYLAYDSLNYAVRVSTSVSSMSDRTWDNNYHSEFEQYYMTTSKSASKYFKKKVDTSEKIEKIKFYVYGEGGQYNLSISSNSERFNNIKSFTVDHAGLYTIDLHDQNVVITDSGFNVEIIGQNNVSFIKDTIEAFTSNVSNTPVIETDDIHVKSGSGNYSFRAYSRTKNIPSNSTVSYTLKNSSGTNYTNYLTVTNNIVAKNDINANVSISSSVPTGIYDLITTYNGYSFTAKVYLGVSMDLTGSGTVSSPYIIQTAADLKKMAYDLSAHYKLGNNINLSGEWTPIGTKENPFTGSLNGNGYKISNLKISREYDYSGLFGYVSINSSNTTSFKNITLESPVIDASGDAGALIGLLTGQTDYDGVVTCSATIQDVFVLNGHVYSYFGSAGSIIGTIQGPINDYMGKHTYTFNRILTSSSVGGLHSSGMIGDVAGASISNFAPTINMTNIENIGWMDFSTVRGNKSTFFTGTHGSIIGYAIDYSKINLNYYISTAYYKNYALDESNDGIIGYASSDVTTSVSNGYSIMSSNTTINDLIDANSYSSWSGFSTNWVKQTVDSIDRIPIIKGAPITYSDLSDITINVGDTVNLSNYLNIKKDAFIKLFIGPPNNENVISVDKLTADKSGLYYDVKITGLAEGTSKFYAYSTYDGYKRILTVTVKDNNPKTTITFHKNDGSNTTSTQSATYGSSITLQANSFTRSGYSFSKWNTKADGTGTNYTNKQTFTTSEYTLNLYALWSPHTYSIKYNSNGGSGTMSNTSATYDTSVNLRANSFSKTGYVFDSWNTKTDGTGEAFTNQQSVRNLTTTNNGTVNLYVQWLPITYNVIYNANGGSGSMSNTLCEYDKSYSLSSNSFTRVGYTFAGWNTKADGSGTSYANRASIKNLTTTNNGTITLYAQWLNNAYTIAYNNNGGSGSMSNTSATYGNSVNLRTNTFIRTGYTFTGWNTKADGTGTNYSNGATVSNLTSTNGATVTLYAKWSANTYTIVYNSNGGSGTMSNTSATYGNNVTLRTNAFTKSGNTFTGWNTKADGSGTSYSNGATVKNLTAVNNGTVTLYAQWNDGSSSYSISYTTDENNKTIDDIALNTSLSSYQSHFTLHGYTMSISLGDKQYIYTGSKVNIIKSGSTEATYTNIVRGDTSGDGIINSADMLQLRQHMLNAKQLTGVYFKAGDIDKNNSINSADLLRMRQHLLGVKPIS